MKPLRKIELHQQGIVILSPDEKGQIKRDVEDNPKPGDWYFSQDGVTKVVFDEGGKWIEAEPPTLDELLVAEQERREMLEMARPLSSLMDHCEKALRVENGTIIMKIFSEGVAETCRDITFQLPKLRDSEPNKSVLTHSDCLKILGTVHEVVKARLELIKAKLNVR